MKFISIVPALLLACSATSLSREYMGGSLGLSDDDTYSTLEQADHQKEIQEAERQAMAN